MKRERKSVRFFWMRVCMAGHLTSFYGTKKERKCLRKETFRAAEPIK